MEKIAENINILGGFCAKRDLPELTRGQLKRAYGMEQADVLVLFGGSILCGGDVFAQAMREDIARKYIIVGGEGHTTETLRRRVHAQFPAIETAGRPEAEVFAEYLRHCYGLQPDFLECRSTNCGNNITNLLELLRQNEIECRSIILIQDASMQRRMEAGLRRHAGEELTIINYAAYSAAVAAVGGALRYTEEIRGMWEVERYLSLLLGEIPRLSDDENGYGPKGKGFIAHVEIPAQVRRAFDELCREFPHLVREANPLYASK
ncbi:MAG: ElyC/SanA/YdcF family protein [Eubacteriales bacterium]|nr:ElyC/SanA/YdcF family protein [Eubacteriales bacterium]